jgi:hypothetical protein
MQFASRGVGNDDFAVERRKLTIAGRVLPPGPVPRSLLPSGDDE